MTHFLIRKNAHQSLLDVEEFSDMAAALSARFAAERKAGAGDEIVVVTAPSRAALRRTHLRLMAKDFDEVEQSRPASGVPG